MNNLKHLLVYTILLFTFFSFLQSCERKEEVFVVEVVKCTEDTPWGECDNEEDICYRGTCVVKDAICGEIFAPCEDKYDICEQDLDNGGYKCVEGRCSYNNTNGTCKNEEQICSSTGVCKYKCSEDHKDGICSEGNSCLEGVCVDTSLLCSDILKNSGLCEEGKVCALNETTSKYDCLDECSESFPQGACTMGKSCHFNKCYHDEALCSEDNLTGVCEDGKFCDNGVCERKCSDLVQNGVCEFDDQVCFNGKCSFKCSSVRLDGVCEDIATKCVEGICKYKCSSTVQDGYCDEDNLICIDGYCKDICSPEKTDGVCKDRSQSCDNGSCEYKCSIEYPFGVCLEDGKGCLNGTCVEECSQLFPNGSCPQYFQCTNEECVEMPCGEANLNGPCFNDGEKCIQGICLGECSSLQPNGWCVEENFVCNNNNCVDSTQQLCSDVFTNGYCPLSEQTCVDGVCLKKRCSSDYPSGRCEDGRICNNGICEAYSCSDGRPLYSGGEIGVNSGGISGACCQVNEDCKDGFDSFGKFITNICIQDQNSQGPYCLGIQLTSNDNGQTNNEPMLCFATSCNGCQSDDDCVDPYATYGTEEEYFCAMVTYYDFEVQANTPLDVNISYCQRVFPNCERKSGLQGDTCNENCGDSECTTGLHCVKGVCTEQCKDDSYCSGISSCIPISYHLPDTDKNLFLDVCLAACDNDETCRQLGPNYSCSAFTNKSQVLPEQIPAPIISYCRDLDTNLTVLRNYCSDDDRCNSRVCNEDNVCSSVCAVDADCGANAYCHYNALKTGKIVHLDRDSDPIDLNYLGECRYLYPSQEPVSECSGKSDCSTATLDNREYQCLPKFDLLKGLPNGKSGESTYGRCGVLNHELNKAYSSEGGVCNNNNQLCESDLCVCGSELCKDDRVGKCANYCEKSTDCNGDEYCKRIILREDVKYSKSLYGGVCESRHDNVDIDECNTNSSSFDAMCSNGKTCIYNPVNTKPEADNPNKFGVEYICVNKRTDKQPLNSTCQSDSDCNSQLCNPNTNKCSHACTSNSQCGDINSTCNRTNVLISDVNPDFIVYSGVCD